MLLAGVAFFATACEKDSLLSDHEGGVSFNIQMISSSTTRAGDTTTENGGETGGNETPSAPAGPVISPINVRIYRPATTAADDNNYTTLIRRYSALEDIPNPLFLVAGKYQIKVEGGNKSKNKSFKEPETAIERQEKLCYEGYTNFVINAHQSTNNIEVACTPVNVKINSIFDTSDAELDATGKKKYENRLISNVKITIVAMAYVADGENKTTPAKIKAENSKLEFGGTGVGYFILPDGVSDIVYLFEGDHETDGHIEFVGHTSVSKGYAYTVNFRYARTPDGFAGITLALDTEPTDIIEDKFYFKPQPEIKATGIDLNAVNDYKRGESVTLACESINTLTKITLGDNVIFENNIATVNNTVTGITATATDDSNTKVNITLSPEYFNSVGGSMQSLNFKMWDSDTDPNQPYEQIVKFRKSGIMDNSEQQYDLWGNRATIKAHIIPDDIASGTSVKIKFRRSDIAADSQTNVYEVTATRESGNEKVWIATTDIMDGENRVFPTYDYVANNGNNHAIYKPNTATGIYAGNAYTYDLYIGDTLIDSHTLTPEVNQPISGGDFENSQMNCFKDLSESNVVSLDWCSGNNSYTEDGHLCRFSSYAGMGGSGCTYLQARTAGMLGINMLAAGNLFTGDFKKPGTSGTVSFGMKYTWSARPTALKFKYQGNIGAVDRTDKNDVFIAKTQQDQASVLVAIVKWGNRHGVTSGTGDPSGMWSPDNGVNSVGEGEIVGYGLAYPTTETKDATTMTTYYVPIVYYDINATAADLNAANYSLVISFATSRYGDYMNGCSSSHMYIDDVEWHYGAESTFENVFTKDTF